ncbi:kinase-like domain-containing protein [Chlamydoabsidia padenii]|nr:kinase-like domain-containing protein [Chlamydoabsidia padenii]
MTRWFSPTILQFTSTSWHHSPVQTEKPTHSSAKHRHVKHYRLLQKLAHGSTCTVYLALNTKTRKLCAVKEMDGIKLQRQLCLDWLQSRHPKNHQKQLSDNHKRRRIDPLPALISTSCLESELLQSLHHDNIIEWLDQFKENGNLYLVTEWIDGTVLVNLHDDYNNRPENDNQHGSSLDPLVCHSVFTQLVDTLDYLHQENVIHGDVKPDNILLTKDNHIKLIDFGSAIKLDSDANTYRRRTPAFTPPECMKKQPDSTNLATRKHYETAGDVWCLGMTLYCMVYGRLAYVDLYSFLSTCTPPHTDTTDPRLCHLIDRMLTRSPLERITLDQIKCHSWFVGDPNNPS